MKAAVYKKYGPPEVVHIEDIAIPEYGAGDVLIKVYASSVNRTDAGFRSAEYFVSRFFSGLLKPKFNVLGCEFAGVVEAVGASVTEFVPGDRIFGFNDTLFGGHAEYMVVPANSGIAHTPPGMDFTTAAALTEGSHYALVDIRAAKVQQGDQVMVYGATGAIGSAAVQIMKHMGATVTAVCNTKNVELVRSLGADVVIDYQQQDYTAIATRFSFIFDAVGKSSFGKCKPLLTEKGIYISTELGKNGENILLALTTPMGGGKRLLFPLPFIKKEDVLYLRELAIEGAFKPVIDSVYPLDKIVEAYRYVETGQKTGNVIIKIRD